jgi:nitrate/nitrite transporter NarK
MIWLSARFMGGLTPLTWVVLTVVLGLNWRQALWLFAGLAGVWSLIFYLWFTNLPEEHRAVNRAERDLIEAGRTPHGGHHGVPWRRILTSRNLWFICGMYMVTNFCWYFMMYFLPGVMKSQFAEMNSTTGGKLLVALLAGSPMLLGMAGCLLGGMLTDRYVRRTGDRKWGRRIYSMIGYGMAGVCYLLATVFIGNFWAFAACVMLMGFFNDLIMGSAWATCQDVGRRYAAIVAGCMNMIGNLAGAMTNFITGTVLKLYEPAGGLASVLAGSPSKPVENTLATGISIMFVTYAIVYGVGVLLWLKIDASKPIVPDEFIAPHADTSN